MFNSGVGNQLVSPNLIISRIVFLYGLGIFVSENTFTISSLSISAKINN